MIRTTIHGFPDRIVMDARIPIVTAKRLDALMADPCVTESRHVLRQRAIDAVRTHLEALNDLDEHLDDIMTEGVDDTLPTVIARGLRSMGADGLISDDHTCACTIDKRMTCEGMQHHCRAAKYLTCPACHKTVLASLAYPICPICSRLIDSKNEEVAP